MSRNYLYICGKLGNHVANVLDVTINVPTAIEIDKRKHAGKEIIAHVDDVRSCEEDHRIAVGVPMRKMNHPNLFAVEVDRQRLIKRDYGQGLLRCGLNCT